MTIRRKALFGAFVFVLSVMGAASAASASPPEIERIDRTFSFRIADFCGEGADLLIDSERSENDISFTNDEGEETRQIQTFNGTTTYTRSDTGNSESFRNSVTRIDEITDDGGSTSTFNGPQVVLTIRGQGTLGLTVGRTVVEDGEVVFEAGPNEIDGTFLTSICEALG